METVYCPGCASDLQDGNGACPVCRTPRAGGADQGPRRNPFRLVALCVAYAVAFWLASMFVIDLASGTAGSAQPGHGFSGTLLLASIGLSIALTVCGKLPGTRVLTA